MVVVTPTFYPEPIGTPLYAADLCRWFSARGWDVHVVTGQPFYPEFKRYESYGRRTRHDKLDEITLTRLPTVVPREGRAAWRAISDLNFLVQGVLRAPRLPRPDAVLSVSPGTPWSTLVGAAIARRTARHVSLVHDIQTGLAASTSTTNRLLQAVIAVSERRSLGVADNVLTLTTNMVDALEVLGVPAPLGVLPLWSTVTPPTDFEPLRPEVQYSGSFGGKQALSQLPALAQALNQFDIPLRVRGSGPLFDALLPELLAATDDRLIAEALAPPDQLPAALSMSPVHVVLQAPGTGSYVMPSKILNALACGSTVVAMADYGSPVSELARRVPGLHVVPTTGVDVMTTTIRDVMRRACDPATRRYIAEAAAREFSKERVLRGLEVHLLAPGSKLACSKLSPNQDQST